MNGMLVLIGTKMARKNLFAWQLIEVKSGHCFLLLLVVIDSVGSVESCERLSDLLSVAVFTGQATCRVCWVEASATKHLK